MLELIVASYRMICVCRISCGREIMSIITTSVMMKMAVVQRVGWFLVGAVAQWIEYWQQPFIVDEPL